MIKVLGAKGSMTFPMFLATSWMTRSRWSGR